MSGVNDIRSHLPRLLREATATRSCRRARSCRATTRRCCSPTPAWCSSRTSSPASRSAPYSRARPPRRNACAPAASTTTSTMSATPRATTPSSRCSATSRSATTSRSARSSSPGTCSPRSSASPTDRLLVTVYHDDDEAFDLWKKIAGLPDERIIRIATSGQFLGDGRHRPVRPVLGDLLRPRRPHSRRPAGQPDADGDRFIEIWNLVFMQFEQLAERRARRPAAAVDRHRHGPRAHRRRPAGRARQLRHRPVPRADRGRRASATGVDADGPQTRQPPRDRRPPARLRAS